MSHMWDRGVLNESSWHGLETIGTFTDAQSMIDHGLNSGAWPVKVRMGQASVEGVVARERGVILDYLSHPSRVGGFHGKVYNPNSAENWQSLLIAAKEAGAQPTGAFSLDEGRVVIATFQVNGFENGIVTNLLLADSFDGTKKLTCGTTSIRVVCANTLAMAMSANGSGMAGLKHTSSLDQKVSVLRENIGVALETGKTLRETFQAATELKLTKESFNRVFDALYPLPAANDASERAKTRAENKREEAMAAAVLPINKVGELGEWGNLGTLWNAATWLVDRDNDGKLRSHGESEPLESLLFGARGRRVAEIQSVITRALAA